MKKEYSLISVNFKRMDVKDLILITWHILPSGAPTIVKGELLEDDVEINPGWKDERHSHNRGLRLFGVVKQAMMKKHGLLPKKKIKIGIDPKGAEIIAPVHEVPTSDDLIEKAEALVAQAEVLMKSEAKAAEAAKLRAEEEAKNKDKEDPLSSGANPFESLKVKELQGILEQRSTPYPPKANKASLIAIILDPSIAKVEASTAE